MMTPQFPNDLQVKIAKVWETICSSFSPEKRQQLADETSKAMDDISTAFSQSLDKMDKELTDLDQRIAAANAANVVYQECDVVDSQRLFGVAKSIMAKGANGIAVFRERKEAKGLTGEVVVTEALYLANVKDSEPLPPADNKYAIIMAKALTADVQGLFADNQLVILN